MEPSQSLPTDLVSTVSVLIGLFAIKYAVFAIWIRNPHSGRKKVLGHVGMLIFMAFVVIAICIFQALPFNLNPFHIIIIYFLLTFFEVLLYNHVY